MAQSSPLLRLSDEILRNILDQIEANPNKLVSLDRRGYLSQESFALPPPASRGSAQDIGSLRCTCRRLADLGAIHLFARIAVRFSRNGFRSLEWLAKQQHLAEHVRKMSYLVPQFYWEGRSRLRDYLPLSPSSPERFDIRIYEQKLADQHEIVSSGKDLDVFRKAAKSFTSLHHVQILRVQDEEDDALLSYIGQHRGLEQLVQLDWLSACEHATRILAIALVEGQSPCTRFSSPMASGRSAWNLSTGTSSSTFRAIATNLTSLEVHFDDNIDLDNIDLDYIVKRHSNVFKEVFSLARNIQSLHVGFPQHRPIAVPFGITFDDLPWTKLSSFGIQSWKLDGDEIVSFVRRHRESLRGLRLRDVLLNEGSTWKEVLTYLHNELPLLEWVSLRRIGYTKTFPGRWTEVTIPDHVPTGHSDSSDLDSDVEQESGYDSPPEDASDELRESRGSPIRSEASTDQPLPTGSPGAWSMTRERSPSNDNAGVADDDGAYVSNAQRRRWERWVISKGALG